MPQRRNLIINPSFEVDTSSWQGGLVSGGLGALTRSQNQPASVISGAWYGFIDPAAGDVRIVSDPVPVAAGLTYTASAYGSRSASGTVQAFIDWLDDALAVISSSTGTTASGVTNTGTRVSCTATAPAGATSARLRLVYVDTGTGNGSRLDAALFELGDTLRTYFDGDTAGARWAGTAHNSVSILDGEPRRPLRPPLAPLARASTLR